jgi:hypothetical protein
MMPNHPEATREKEEKCYEAMRRTMNVNRKLKTSTKDAKTRRHQTTPPSKH